MLGLELDEQALATCQRAYPDVEFRRHDMAQVADTARLLPLDHVPLLVARRRQRAESEIRRRTFSQIPSTRAGSRHHLVSALPRVFFLF